MSMLYITSTQHLSYSCKSVLFNLLFTSCKVVTRTLKMTYMAYILFQLNSTVLEFCPLYTIHGQVKFYKLDQKPILNSPNGNYLPPTHGID